MREVIVEPNVLLVSSLRSIGYSFDSAICDLIDNSIAAKSRRIDIVGDVLAGRSLSVIDDGLGMSMDVALKAMEFAGTAHTSRTANDLGKFGLGLKTASFSQAKQLTVVSKRDNQVIGLRWDIQHILDESKWALQILDPSEIEGVPNADRLHSRTHGTLVTWTDLDVLGGDAENAADSVATKLEGLHKEIGLIFHKFLTSSRGAIVVTINGLEVQPIDPFLSNHKKTQIGHSEPVRIGGEIVKLTTYTLPHYTSLSPEDRRRADLGDSMRDSQGFYIYRKNRLISRGHWFGMTSRSELTKLTRIQIEVPPELDDMWQLDVMKSKAEPPAAFKAKLRNLLAPLTDKSRSVISFRGRSQKHQNFLHVWQRIDMRGEFHYEINLESPLVASVLNRIDPEFINDIKGLLVTIANSFPFDDAYQLIASDTKQAPLGREDLVDTLATLRPSLNEFDVETIGVLLSHTEPFSRLSKSEREALIEEVWSNR